ncbi:18328_t:CDS:2, partial [Rhizophagus irregularis]
MYSKGLAHYNYDYSHKGWKKIVNRLIDNVKSCPTGLEDFQDPSYLLMEINYGDRIQAKDMP